MSTSYLLSKSRRGTTGCLTEQLGYHKRCILVSAGRVVCGSGSHRFLLWSFRFAQVLSLCMFLFVHHSERCYFFTGTVEKRVHGASVLTVFKMVGLTLFRVRGELKYMGQTGCLYISFHVSVTYLPVHSQPVFPYTRRHPTSVGCKLPWL